MNEAPRPPHNHDHSKTPLLFGKYALYAVAGANLAPYIPDTDAAWNWVDRTADTIRDHAPNPAIVAGVAAGLLVLGASARVYGAVRNAVEPVTRRIPRKKSSATH